MSTVVIYHASCTDGFCAAWLFGKAFPDATFVPAQYGSPPPPVGISDFVYVLDFSYPKDVMLALRDRAQSLLVLDHHKTAKADCEGLDFCQFDMERSGAVMAFDYLALRGLANFVGDTGIRRLAEYVQDRDLWQWKLPFSKEINSAIRSYPMSFEAWDTLPGRLVGDLLQDEGLAIERYRQMAVQQHVNNAREIEIAGHKIKGVYCSLGEIGSEVAEALIGDDRPFGCFWFDLEDGSRVYSLRSRGECDVGAIAKSFGGGGHKNASGFKMPSFVQK